jgi:hypothetical protein
MLIDKGSIRCSTPSRKTTPWSRVQAYEGEKGFGAELMSLLKQVADCRVRCQ